MFAVTLPAGLYVGAQTIANAALPQMQGDLSAGIDQISWVLTASVVASAIGIPPASWLAVRFGRSKVMIASMLLFTISSGLVGLADSMSTVVLFRIFQSFFGAPIVALSQTITIDVFPEEERAQALAGWSIGLLVGWVMAPSIGALIAETYSWRAIFFFLVPFGLLGTFTVALATKGETKGIQRPFDWFGFVTISSTLVCFLIVLNRGQREDWFESNQIILLTGLGIITLYYFVVHTVNTPVPFLRWEIFKDRNYCLGIVIVFVYAGLTLAPLVLIPTMLAELKGLELLTTGLVLVPRGITQILGLMIIGYLVNRFDPRTLSLIGFLAYAAGGWPMVNYTMDVGWWDVVWPNMVQGVAMSFMLIPATTLLYANIAENLRVDAASVMQLTYSLSSSIGVALAVTWLSRSSQVMQEELSANVIPSNELLRFAQNTHIDFNSVASLLALKAEVSYQALMVAYVNIYWATLLITLLTTPIMLFFRVPKSFSKG